MRISNHIKSAVGSLSQHNKLSHDIMTTLDFGQLCPTLCLPLLPRDKITVNASCFCRVAPMIFPTYGQCDIVTNFHSVSYSQVWKNFENFVTGINNDGVTSIAFPCIKQSQFNILFTSSNLSYKGDASIDNYDLAVIKNDGTWEYRFLTLYGRYVRKVLSSLGYPYFTAAYITTPESEDYVFSALPLMCFFKIYADFYESRQYAQTSVLREMLRQCFSLSSSGSSYFVSGTPSSIEGVNCRYFIGLQSIFSHLKLLFTSDYVTSAQTYPALVGGQMPIGFFGSTDVSHGNSFFQEVNLSQNRYNTTYLSPVLNDEGTSVIEQSNPMHRLLDNFENLVRRFNLVGSREIDRVRAMFGIKPSFSDSFYSNFHGGFSSPLQVQDVTSTSAEPSVDNYLGSYAGKGISSNGKTFSIDSNDFGLLIGISFIRVRPLYVPGLSREVLKTSMSGYYNPDFDHGYAMAVSNGEVQSFQRTLPSGSSNSVALTSVFGFQNAYDDYRQQLSRVNGDFLDTDLLSWSFVRDNVGTVAQSDNVIYFDQPSTSPDNEMYSEFQRVFVDGSGRDHFYASFGFNISALRPVRTSSECFDLGVGNVSTSNNPVI